MSVKWMVVVMTFSVMAWKSLGLKWTTEALHTNSCEGQDTILLWNYSLEKNETVQDNQWFFQSTQIAYESESVKFLVSPLYKGRVERIGKMGILLKNVSSRDTGNYSLYLNLGPESPEIMQAIFLTVFESPTYQCKPSITKNPDNVLFCSTNSCEGIQLSTEWRISETFYSKESYLEINSSWNAELVSCCLHRQCQNCNFLDVCASAFIFFAEDKHAPDSGCTENSVNLTAAVIVLALIIVFLTIAFVIYFCYRKKKCRLCGRSGSFRTVGTSVNGSRRREGGTSGSFRTVHFSEIDDTSGSFRTVHFSENGSRQSEDDTSGSFRTVHISENGSRQSEGMSSDYSDARSHLSTGDLRLLRPSPVLILPSILRSEGMTSGTSLSTHASESDFHGSEGRSGDSET